MFVCGKKAVYTYMYLVKVTRFLLGSMRPCWRARAVSDKQQKLIYISIVNTVCWSACAVSDKQQKAYIHKYCQYCMLASLLDGSQILDSKFPEIWGFLTWQWKRKLTISVNTPDTHGQGFCLTWFASGQGRISDKQQFCNGRQSIGFPYTITSVSTFFPYQFFQKPMFLYIYM